MEFVKQYYGKHAIHYHGQLNDKGTKIVGNWEIPDDSTGAFNLKFKAKRWKGYVMEKDDTIVKK